MPPKPGLAYFKASGRRNSARGLILLLNKSGKRADGYPNMVMGTSEFELVEVPTYGSLRDASDLRCHFDFYDRQFFQAMFQTEQRVQIRHDGARFSLGPRRLPV